jgi:hypothetical protein
MGGRLNRLAIAGLAIFGLVRAAWPAAAAPVDLALVVAVDVSLSVDDARYAVQRDGTAAAFESEAVAQSIAGGPAGAIEVAVLEFSDPDRQWLAVPWTRLGSATDARAFARRLRAARRSSSGLTGLADALLGAEALIAEAPFPAARRVVDVSSDGMSNVGSDLGRAREQVVAAGITINGLPIVTGEPSLESYYRDEVVGGPDAFVEVARGMAAFGEAMRRKLVRELVVSALGPTRPQPSGSPGGGRLMSGAAVAAPEVAP